MGFVTLNLLVMVKLRVSQSVPIWGRRLSVPTMHANAIEVHSSNSSMTTPLTRGAED